MAAPASDGLDLLDTYVQLLDGKGTQHRAL